MSIKRNLFNLITDAFIKVLFLNRANRISCSFADKLNPLYRIEHNNEEYVLSCPNEVTRWRAETYFTKEPETIEWIDSFKREDVLFDVGANVGLYSMYAAKKGVNVVAFEPESQNYGIINRNLYMNKCSDRVMCLNIALSDRDCLDYLYIPKFQAGGSVNCFGERIDYDHREFIPVFNQGIISYTLDTFLSQYPHHFPTHLKIDVDGIESKIIKGADKTLLDTRLRSILIEVNESLQEHAEMVKSIEQKGFSLLHKKHSEIFDDTPFNKFYNYLFVKKS